MVVATPYSICKRAGMLVESGDLVFLRVFLGKSNVFKLSGIS